LGFEPREVTLTGATTAASNEYRIEGSLLAAPIRVPWGDRDPAFHPSRVL